jgi:ParB/RepB/Spo0J family partition protein
MSPRGTTVERIVPIHQIEVEENLGRVERVRVADQGLVENIREVGLINPLTVEEIGKDRYRLVAGENRLLALRELGEKVARCSVRTFASDVDARITALAENIHRQNITLYEETILVHQLVAKHHANLDDIARKLGSNNGQIRTLRAMIRAPEVFTREQWAIFKRAALQNRNNALRYLHAALSTSKEKRAKAFEEDGEVKRERLSKPSTKTLRSIRDLVDQNDGILFREIALSPRERSLAVTCLSIALGDTRVPFTKPGHKLQAEVKEGVKTLTLVPQRGRGRPRKTPIAVKVPGRRGRPRKTPIAPPTPDGNPATESNEKKEASR